MSKLSKKKNLLITGASGFLGKNILKKISKKDYKVTLVTRKKIPGYKNIIINNFFKLNQKEFLKILRRQEIVLHLAWYAKPNKYLHSKINLECLYGSLNFVLACKKSKIRKFIGIGTCLEYKFKNKILSTKDLLQPNSIYSASKMILYNFCKSLFKSSKIQFSWCRIFYLYGKGEPKTKLFSFVKSKIKKKENFKIYGAGHIKDFINIEEASKQIVQVIKSNKYFDAINICTGKGQSVKNFIYSFLKKEEKKYIKFKNIDLSNTNPKYLVGENSIKLNLNEI